MDNKIERLAKLARRGHYYCEDGWYSCPLAEEGCADDSIDKTKCNCGADKINAKIDAILAEPPPDYAAALEKALPAVPEWYSISIAYIHYRNGFKDGFRAGVDAARGKS